MAAETGGGRGTENARRSGSGKTEEKEEREPGNPAVRQNMEFREKDSEENTGEEWKISEQTEWEKTEQRENENISGEMKKQTEMIRQKEALKQKEAIKQKEAGRRKKPIQPVRNECGCRLNRQKTIVPFRLRQRYR